MTNKNDLESVIQKRIVRRLERDGWFVIKLILTNCPGIPDLIALKNGSVKFIEVKRPGQKPRPLQLYRHQQLRELGFDVKMLTE